jgi:transcriptional regulator with XRE-family HTH domain
MTVDRPFPNRLRALREPRTRSDGSKLLIEDVAAKVGCSIGYLARLERGLQRPNRQLLEALAAFYEVSPDSIEEGEVKVEMTDAKIVGAWLRVLRQRKRLSIDAVARAMPMKVSASQVRLIEAGQRAFAPGDSLIESMAAFLGGGSAMQAFEAAKAAYRAGELDESLRELHPQVYPILAEPRAFRMGLRDEPVELPDYVAKRMHEGEVAYFIDRQVDGEVILQAGSFCIVPSKAALGGGLVLDQGTTFIRASGTADGARGHDRTNLSPGAVNILVIIPPCAQ